MRRARALWESFVIACSMYSRLPVPQLEWTEDGLRHALCFFPFIGVVLGTAEWGFLLLAGAFGLGNVARACIATSIPLLLTGGIHMDGFLDTTDARSSFADAEKRLQILKDPHVGAFAVIGGGLYLLLYVAVFSELRDEMFPAAGAVYVMTRALSGLSVVCFPKAKKDGLVSTFSGKADTRVVKTVLIIWFVLSALWFFRCLGIAGGCLPVIAALAVFAYYGRMAKREFGGVTGDLAGWFLQVCELVMLAVLAAEGRSL